MWITLPETTAGNSSCRLSISLRVPLTSWTVVIAGGNILAPPATHDCALLVVSGSVEVVLDAGGRASLSAGMGVVIEAGQDYTLKGLMIWNERRLPPPSKINGEETCLLPLSVLQRDPHNRCYP